MEDKPLIVAAYCGKNPLRPLVLKMINGRRISIAERVTEKHLSQRLSLGI